MLARQIGGQRRPKLPVWAVKVTLPLKRPRPSSVVSLDKWRKPLNWDLALPFLHLEGALVPEQLLAAQVVVVVAVVVVAVVVVAVVVVAVAVVVVAVAVVVVAVAVVAAAVVVEVEAAE